MPLEMFGLVNTNSPKCIINIEDTLVGQDVRAMSLVTTLASSELASTEPSTALSPNKLSSQSDMGLQLQSIERSLHTIQANVVPDKKAWMKYAPHLAVKEQYVNHEGPPAKGDGLCLKAIWPKEPFGKDAMHLQKCPCIPEMGNE